MMNQTSLLTRPRAIAAFVLVAWAGILIVDMRSLKARPEVKEQLKHGTHVKLFGKKVGGTDEET